MTTKENVPLQAADLIESMRSTALNYLLPEPIRRWQDEKFQGQWFTDLGSGPFDTLAELEDWCTHKIDVCAMVKQLPDGASRFEFKDEVLTRQDLALRNLILDTDMKIWVFDLGCAGVYTNDFEQAALWRQAESEEFSEMVLKEAFRPTSYHNQTAWSYNNIGFQPVVIFEM
ncbi:kinase-like domain protein [Fusarium beomiforme]|uniref:Kinase-like domain protein n=1 Tax=Fusarium beomiforme TaxID=44412 RepID=A0A9P5DTW8_9HYPO|nr:kinase-like domain protein [Fusarium beomiforme]